MILLLLLLLLSLLLLLILIKWLVVVVVAHCITLIRPSPPVHNALKLSDVLGQMSANSSKIILPAEKNAKFTLNLNQARFKSFRFEVLLNLPSFVPTYSSFYVTNRLRLLFGNLIDFNQLAKIIHKKD